MFESIMILTFWIIIIVALDSEKQNYVESRKEATMKILFILGLPPDLSLCEIYICVYTVGGTDVETNYKILYRQHSMCFICVFHTFLYHQ